MPKMRRKFVAALAVLFCILLLLSTALFIPKTEKASAARGSNFIVIGSSGNDLYKGGSFNGELLFELYATITGEPNATYETVADKLDNEGRESSSSRTDNSFKFLNSADFRSKNDDNNLSIYFGGIKWDVVCLTTVREDDKYDTDSKIKGDIVIDLWQSADNCGTGKWADYASSRITCDEPYGIYSTSYVRVVSLNAGGKYATGNSATSASLSSEQSKSADNTYASFTMTQQELAEQGSDKVSLIDFLVQPKDIGYQEDENSLNFGIQGGTYANEAYGTPLGEIRFHDNTNMPRYLSKNYYSDWKDDYVWLPSWTEAGHSASNYWYTDVSLRSSTATAAWTRSTAAIKVSSTTYNCVYAQDGSGTGISTNGNEKNSYQIRPAIHLNLTKAMEKAAYAPQDVETTYTGSKLTLADLYATNTSDYTTNSKEAPWYLPEIYKHVDFEYKLDSSVSSVLNVSDKYTVTMTFKNDATAEKGYSWESPDQPNGRSKTIKIKVTKKKVKVQFTSQATVTTGDFNSYPKVDYMTGQIATDDLPNGENYSKNYPTLRIKYQNADSNTPAYNKYEQPTIPGTYRATAEIDAEKVTNLNYEIITSDGSYKNWIEFTVLPKSVAKPSVLDAADLTYNGYDQTVSIGTWSEQIKYTVSKDGSQLSSDNTERSFTVKEAGNYTVTFAIADEYIQTYAWGGVMGETEPFNVPFEVKKAQLDLKFVGVDNDSSVKFDEGVWGMKTQVKFDVQIDGLQAQDKVVLNVYYTDKDGGNPTPAPTLGDNYYIPGSLPQGDNYKMYCQLAPSTSPETAINANYEIKYAIEGRLEKAFKITTAQSKFNADDLVWGYKNAEIDNGNSVQAFEKGNKVTYNGEEFTVSLMNTNAELEALGVKVDGGLDGEIRGKNAGTYTVQVKIVAYSADYKFDDMIVTFVWYIDKAEYDLKDVKLEWSYRARGAEVDVYPEDGIQFEGGEVVGSDGYIEVYVSGGLPDGLTVKSIIHNGYYEIGEYTAEIESLNNSDDNYKNVGSLADYDWAKFDWKIIKRTLSTDTEYWSEAEYEDGEDDEGTVTKKPTLATGFYNPKIRYEYYDNASCTDAITGDLKYENGKTKTFWVKAFIDESDATNVKNWALGTEKNPYEFTVGEAKIAVEIDVTSGGTYDGLEKPVKIEIVNTVAGIDTKAFKVTYYKANSNVALAGAPKDAGSYRAVISLEAGYTGYYIKSEKIYNFTIETRVLDIPTYEGNLTYNGEERDVAELVELPKGWENYITITVNSLTSGVTKPDGYKIKLVADYEVVFKINADVNTGTPNNVEWSDNSKTQKKLNISIVKLVLHAEGWEEEDYDSYIVFTENNVDKFVKYTVTDVNGKEVDRATVEKSENESFIVTVSVLEEHFGNVEIEFRDGVSNKYEFFTNGGIPPVKVKLPTIPDLVFNGENQTFTVDYGEFEEYIEIDTSLSSPSALSQFDAGEYSIYFKIKSGVNAVWADTEKRNAIEVKFTMQALVLADPQVKEGEKFTYNGSEQSATLNIDGAILAKFMVIEGDYKATNAGDYRFTLSINPSFAGNVVWESAADKKSVDWTIEKAKISVKWTDSDVPELDLPAEFNDVDVEYEIRDENGNVVTRDKMEAGGQYTITAKLKDGSAANYEFVDESGKPLKIPTMTDGMSFQYRSAGSAFPWWIIAVAVGLLLLVAVIIIVIKKRQTADGDDEYDDYYDDEFDFDEDIEEDFDDSDFGDDFGDDF